MWEIIGSVVVVLLYLLFFAESTWEWFAISKALESPPATGKEALIGRSARIIHLSSEPGTMTQLRVELDGTSWSAVLVSSDRESLQVGDAVEVTDIDGIKLVVK